MMATSSRKIEIIRETVKDTVVVVKPDSSMIEALLECDSLGNVLMKQILAVKNGERMKPPDLVIRNNTLRVVTSVDSNAIHLLYKERYKELDTREEAKEKTIVEVNKLTPWQKLRLHLANIVLIIIPVAITIKLKKLWKTNYQRIAQWLTKG